MDTLQKVREAGNENYSYSMDYQNITALKLFSDRNNVAILVVHHTRKMEASDSFDMISGTNGLLIGQCPRLCRKVQTVHSLHAKHLVEPPLQSANLRYAISQERK